jgi:hypothetical protein
MRVRVYDKETGRYFKSEVYAVINEGWYAQYLVLVPDENGAYLKLFDYLDKSREGPIYPVNVNVITKDVPEAWLKKGSQFLQLIQSVFLKYKSDSKFDSFRGYPWLLDDRDILLALASGNTIRFEDIKTKDKYVSSMLPGWNYVEKQGDADEFMKKCRYFHDSVLTQMSYVSGAGASEGGGPRNAGKAGLPSGGIKPTDDVRRVTMCFDSLWGWSLEAVFEGVVSLNLRPAPDNYSSEISEASIRIKDETVYFFTDYVEKVTDEKLSSHEGTWIGAYGLRWRFLEQ